jgi:hypothetical protein
VSADDDLTEGWLARAAERAMNRLRQYPRESLGPAARLLLEADDARRNSGDAGAHDATSGEVGR